MPDTAKGVGMLFGHQGDTTTNSSSPDPGGNLPAAQTSQSSPMLDNPLADETQNTPVSAPENDAPAVSQTPPLTDTSTPQVDTGLLELKQQALSELGPLVDHLEQTPEEKFRTTMMMIQSTDNQVLLKDAYAAAQAIPDEKARAQALLDVVNEINYFTQHQ
jgi:hypothetical protein